MIKVTNKLLYDYDHLFAQMSKAIAPGDGMFSTGSEAHYFSVEEQVPSQLHVNPLG